MKLVLFVTLFMIVLSSQVASAADQKANRKPASGRFGCMRMERKTYEPAYFGQQLEDICDVNKPFSIAPPIERVKNDEYMICCTGK